MTTTEKPPIIATCSGCPKTVTAKPTKDGSGIKTPMGWKLIDGALLCKSCKLSRYTVRSVRVMIVAVANQDGDTRTMKGAFADLNAAGKDSARFANWLVQKLYAADEACAATLPAKGGKLAMPKMPAVDYYRPATKLFPGLAPASIVSLGKSVMDWYRSRRFDALVAMNRSVENYRFGYLPIEIPKQAWSVKFADDKKNIVVRTQIAPGKSWHFVVSADAINRTRLKMLLSGDAQPLALKLVRRATGAKREDGTAKKTWFMRISILLPRTVARRKSDKEVTLTLGHDPASLWFGALDDKEDVFDYSGALLKSIILRHDAARKRRQSSEAIVGRELSRRTKSRRQDRSSLVAVRNQRRITNELNLACAVAVRWCVAHDVTSVDYDAAPRGFTEHFPYRRLADTLRIRLENVGIAMHRTDTAANEPAAETELALAEPKGETCDTV